MASIDRRTFLTAACAAAFGAGKPPATAQVGRPPGAEEFSFLLLGDTHFDRLEHHDVAWMTEHYQKDIAQVRDYVRKTRETLPLVFQAARRRLAETLPAAAFTVHVGDVVEGICGRPELARRQCREFLEFYDRQRLGLPFFPAKGNHDITGPGAEEAYREAFLGRVEQQLGRRLESACYTVERGNALLAFFDAYDPGSLEWLEGVLRGRDAGHLVVVVHPPVVPYNARSNWCVFSHPKQADRRRRLLELLGRHRAVVLAGHLHKFSALVRRTEGGWFVQLGLSSVVEQPNQPVRGAMEGVARYGGQLANLEPDFQPASAEERKMLLERERPFIEHFQYADTAGFAVIQVWRDAITAEIHVGIAREPWRKLGLSRLALEPRPLRLRLQDPREACALKS
jgi:hypothetical protein